MSLLEDVFLQDEAGEAQELERIIEGDEYEERTRERSDSDENSEKEDEAEEDKRRVDPASTKTKRVVKNPRFILNPARLTGPRGIQVIPDHFKDFKFKGKGREKEDLDLVLKKLEHWAYRLYPKFNFEDCLKKMETLGKKRPVMVHLHKIRSDQLMTEETVVQQDSSDDEPPPAEEDEFDKLLAQQIELARSTPGPASAKKPGFCTPLADKISPITMPKATASPSISDEQKERMLKNRKLAEERRLARLKNQTENTVALANDNQKRSDEKDSSANNDQPVTVIADKEEDEEIRTRKNRSHIIDSSDSDSDMITDQNRIESENIRKSNEVIDITNNELSKNPDDIPVATVSVDSQNNAIDITNGYQSAKIVSGKVNKIANIDQSEPVDDDKEEEVRMRKNRSHIIDSSDSDSDMIIDQNMTGTEDIRKPNQVIDITNRYVRRNETSKNADDIPVETVPVDSQPDVIDITNGYQSAKTGSGKVSNVDSEVIDITLTENNKNSILTNETIDLNEMENNKTLTSNVIDSSDSDDLAVTVVNESITVDVHRHGSQSQTKNVMDTESRSEQRNDDISKFNDNDIGTLIGQDNGLNKESRSPDDETEFIKDSPTAKTKLNLDSALNEKENENKVITEESDKNKANVQIESQSEEEVLIMDVDFGDDF